MKNYFEVTHSNSKAGFKKKRRRTIKERKTTRMPFIWFWVHQLAEHTTKSVQYQFTKLVRLTATDTKKGTKIILKLLILTRRPVLRRKQGEPSDREKLRECLIFSSGCSDWKSTSQNLLNINLPNLVGYLQEMLRKEQKFILKFFFLSRKQVRKKQTTL